MTPTTHATIVRLLHSAIANAEDNKARCALTSTTGMDPVQRALFESRERAVRVELNALLAALKEMGSL